MNDHYDAPLPDELGTPLPGERLSGSEDFERSMARAEHFGVSRADIDAMARSGRPRRWVSLSALPERRMRGGHWRWTASAGWQKLA